MIDNDLDRFADLIHGTAEMFGKTLPQRAIGIWWQAMQRYEFSTVEAAIGAHLVDPERGRWMPTPADVVAQVDKHNPDGRPDANEAWAMLSFDESQSFAWTTEMQSAFGLALSVMPDRTAARMAFREAYEREVVQARAKGDPVQWQVSLGTDKAGREAAVEQAVAKGLLQAPVGHDPRLPAPEQSLQATATALIGNAPSGVNAKAEIERLRDALIPDWART